MTRFIKLFFIIFTVILTAQKSLASDDKVLVLPDTIQFERTNYVVFPDASTMFATDAVNEFKKAGIVDTVSMADVRETLRKNARLCTLTKKAIKEFKYNYNVPFVDFKSVAHSFSTNKVLLITSQTDTQNYFLGRTIWDYLNIPGASVVNPTYKLSTYAALIDVDKEQILWQKKYYKSISAIESRMIAQSFAPASEQLQKIKTYSESKIAPDVSKNVRTTLLPPIKPIKENKAIINVSNFQPNAQIPIPDFSESNQKIIIPSKTKRSNYGLIINDL